MAGPGQYCCKLVGFKYKIEDCCGDVIIVIGSDGMHSNLTIQAFT